MSNITAFAFMVGVVPWNSVYRMLCKKMGMSVNNKAAWGLVIFQWVGVITLMYSVATK